MERRWDYHKDLPTISLGVITDILLLLGNVIPHHLGIKRAICLGLVDCFTYFELELGVKDFWTFAIILRIVGIHEIVQVGDLVEKNSASIVPIFQVVLIYSGFFLISIHDFRQSRQVEEFGAKDYAAVSRIFRVGLAESLQSQIVISTRWGRIVGWTLRRLMGSITAFVAGVTFAVIPTASDLCIDVSKTSSEMGDRDQPRSKAVSSPAKVVAKSKDNCTPVELPYRFLEN